MYLNRELIVLHAMAYAVCDICVGNVMTFVQIALEGERWTVLVLLVLNLINTVIKQPDPSREITHFNPMMAGHIRC